MTTSGERADTGLQVVSKVVAVANPAAGADWSFVTTSTVQILCVICQLQASAVVANRTPFIEFVTPGGISLFDNGAPGPIAAGGTGAYRMAPAFPSVNNGGTMTIPIPQGLVLATGSTIRVATINLDAGDQWSAIVLTFAG